MMKTFPLLLIAVMALSCSGKKTMTAEERTSYEAEVNAWHTKRINEVKSLDGWLNLAGLFWLDSGANTFGSGEKNKIIFPAGKIAPEAGVFTVKNNQVYITVKKGVTITSGGKPVTEQIIFHPDSPRTVMLESGSLRWQIIKRGKKTGIRLRDDESDVLKTFTDVERWPVDPGYRVEAKFQKSDSNHTIDITNVIGQTTPVPSPGTLVFMLEGKECRLDVIPGSPDEYSIIFADATTGKETYAGGRFLEVKKPDANGIVFVDFNEAYNPPCVFTPYATCPLPPAGNVLSVAVRSGEKNYRSSY